MRKQGEQLGNLQTSWYPAVPPVPSQPQKWKNIQDWFKSDSTIFYPRYWLMYIILWDGLNITRTTSDFTANHCNSNKTYKYTCWNYDISDATDALF